jgi:tungstate transport system substrate-binding protein
MKWFRYVVIIGVFTLVFSCFTLNSLEAGQALMMATTTSTDNTGLLDSLLPQFIKDTDIELKWVATGTGKALKLGENCDVDVLMVHAPLAEKKYIEAGYGVLRKEVMYNDFVIIGPVVDSAGIKGKTITEALSAIMSKGAVFLSRGDNSGTNKKEKALWQLTGQPLPEKEAWYVQSGQGMLATIRIAEERNGYTITDRGTYIKYESSHKEDPPLKIILEGDERLLNQYSVICINPKHCKSAKLELAMQFSEWITGEKAQAFINEFRLMGKQLFVANAQK